MNNLPKNYCASGLLITIITLASVELLTRIGISVPNPAPIYLTAVVYSTFMGGMVSGIICGALTLFYGAYFFSIPGNLFHYSGDNFARVVVLCLTTPAIIIMVGILKKRNDSLLANKEQLILELKDSFENLRKTGERYKNLFDSSMDGVFQVNADGLFTMINCSGARIFGFETPEEIVGKKLLEYLRDPNDLDAFWSELNIAKIVSAYPMKARKKNGESLELESSSRIIEDNGGNFLGVEGILRDVTDRKHMEEELRSMSLEDELTGLYNRRGFITMAAQELKMADRLKRGISILYADLDGLKVINDTLGHKEGDTAINETAIILRETFRDSDIIGRIGGDEFVIIPIGTGSDNLDVITTRLQKNIDLQNEKIDRNYKLSLSVGISYYDPEHPITIDELLTMADASMYAHKRNKRRT